MLSKLPQGLNADIGLAQSLMLRDELVATAERFGKVTFEAAMKAFREEADQLRKERDDAQGMTLGTSSLHFFYCA